MEAGRELDALIAEKVMGLVRCEKHPGSYCHALPDSPTKGGETRSYSTDISAAWEVVEKLSQVRPTCFIFKISKSPGGNHKVWVYETMFRESYDEFLERLCVEAVEDTAPHAICLAALKAIGYEAKEAQ